MSRGVQVAKKRPNPFTPEFKAEAVRMMQAGTKPVAEVAKDLEISEQSLYRWAKQLGTAADAKPSGALTTAEREELTRLRRELRQVEQERDFLKKTAAYFASEKR
jgi:transposase